MSVEGWRATMCGKVTPSPLTSAIHVTTSRNPMAPPMAMVIGRRHSVQTLRHAAVASVATSPSCPGPVREVAGASASGSSAVATSAPGDSSVTTANRTAAHRVRAAGGPWACPRTRGGGGG